jgi:hypothetical protein
MSQTVPVEVMNRSYWAYVASAMVDGLDQILHHDVAPAMAIPKRVYVDARDFFKLAIEAASDDLPRNPSASISNYIIAAGAAKILVQSIEDRAQLEARLNEYALLIAKLQAGMPPVGGDVQAATALKEFFAVVQQEAETESYERVVQSEGPKNGFGIR